MHIKNTIALSFVVIFFLCHSSFAQMQSNNYRITTSVMSSGGTPASSANYQTNSTLAQPSPLLDGGLNPFSDNYDNYPGFWYTLMFEVENTCDGDFEPDGDVDGSDLAEYISYSMDIGLGDFAKNFGRDNCPF